MTKLWIAPALGLGLLVAILVVPEAGPLALGVLMGLAASVPTVTLIVLGERAWGDRKNDKRAAVDADAFLDVPAVEHDAGDEARPAALRIIQ